MNVEEACAAYADRMTENEVSWYQTNKPERLKEQLQKNPKLIEQFREKKLAEATSLAEGIRVKSPEVVKSALQGRFHPTNHASCMVFMAVTGIAMTKKVNDCRAAVESYFRSEFLAYREACEKAIQASRDLAAAKEKEQMDARVSSLKEKVKAGEKIGGEDLLVLARALGIDVNPRTAGTLKRRVSWVMPGKAGISGRGCPDGVWSLYSEVRELVSPGEEPAADDHEILRLFGKGA